MKHVVYCMAFPDGTEYIGATSNLTSRRAQHRNRAPANAKVAAAWASGPPTFTPIACPAPGSTLRDAEEAVLLNRRPALNCIFRPPKDGVTKRLCDKFGVSVGTYYARRRAGWPALEAIGAKPRSVDKKASKVKQRTLTSNGVSKPIKAWAKDLGVSPATLHSRLSNGWSVDQVVGNAPCPLDVKRAAAAARPPAKKHKQYTHDGFTGNLSELARRAGLSPHLVHARVRRLNWPLELALTP